MRLGNGLIMLMDYETEAVFPYSRHLMDADSGISYEEPSPNSFSFNSPYGYCPTCKGLGQIDSVDMEKVIPDDSKSINEQGIVPLGEVRDNMNFKQLKAIAKKYDFSFATPIKGIPKKALNTILYGGDDNLSVKISYRKQEYTYNLAFDGLLKMLERWYQDTSSEKIRRWTESFMIVSTCPECQGQRLRKESLHFKLNGKNISDLAELDLVALNDWLLNIDNQSFGKAASNRQRNFKRTALALGFSTSRWTQLSFFESACSHAFWRRGTKNSVGYSNWFAAYGYYLYSGRAEHWLASKG